jgi:hypothetical protein
MKIMHDKGIKSESSSFSETQFWVRRLTENPALVNIVLKILLLFPTTYEYDVGFSSLFKIKTKHGNTFNVENDLQYAYSSTTPMVKKLE